MLLTHNEWVEAGLMNGALEYVRGFVWPEDGDPNSADASKQAPLCVIVEFDDVTLGADEIPKEDGVKSMQSRDFFPKMDLGKDASGKPRSSKFVPVFRHRVGSETDDKVYRNQFPLVLAWCLTHWKAQGMNLRRVKISLGERQLRPWVSDLFPSRAYHIHKT